MAHFPYGHLELDHLSRHDPVLGTAITRIGIIERQITPDPFTSLIKSIVSQQISSKGAHTIWGRLCERLAGITPASIATADHAIIQQCGMSMRKASYIKSIGEAVTSGELNIERFPEMSDEEIIRQVSSLHGVGVWTAEMLLIFSLCRPDVVSWGDLAIRRGMMRLYDLQALTKEQFQHYRQRYAPYGSVASFYLWELSVC